MAFRLIPSPANVFTSVVYEKAHLEIKCYNANARVTLDETIDEKPRPTIIIIASYLKEHVT